MQVIKEENGSPIKMWTDGVPVEPEAIAQLKNVARMPFIHSHIAVMPDCHFGIGATVGSVIATKRAVIPASVGVDIGCGMAAVQTTLKSKDLPDSLAPLRSHIEHAIPHGFVTTPGRALKGAWEVTPSSVVTRWSSRLSERFARLIDKHPHLATKNAMGQLGTLGGGNHFIELCLDLEDTVWIMLHSGSRGIGNLIGQQFIEVAKEDMRRHHIRNLPHADLAYLSEGTQHFDDYIEAMTWAQDYASANRDAMMANVMTVLRGQLPSFKYGKYAVSCHHNYCSREEHFGENVIVTRKGAVSAREGELGIIPGSMGAKSFIVRGKGNRESFHSCSHGAGRAMSRTEAKRRFTVEDHAKAVAGVECRLDADVVDETPAAYKNIDQIIAAQSDLIDVVATLKQVLCVKG
jgi:tRNA-splicing ligase RtcB (3'-phosphate/5'-hydroxy nucleic acid ligase)